MWLTCVTWLCKKEKLRNFITFDRSCDQSSLSFLLGRKKAFFIQIPFDTSRAYREINIMRHKNEIDWVDKKEHSSQLVENIYIHALATINYFPPNSMVMFGVIFWFTFHLIWKYYVLHWVFLLFFWNICPSVFRGIRNVMRKQVKTLLRPWSLYLEEWWKRKQSGLEVKDQVLAFLLLKTLSKM